MAEQIFPHPNLSLGEECTMMNGTLSFKERRSSPQGEAENTGNEASD